MKNILAYTGILLEIFAAFMILPVIIAGYYSEPITTFLIPMTISLFLGVVLDKNFTRDDMDTNEGLTLTALTFIIFSIIGSIPYYPIMESEPQHAMLDSFFEGISGFTTTGLSSIENLESVPKSILFWRSETQWLGGIGIIIIFLSILSRLKTSSTSLYLAQGYNTKLEPTIASTARKMMKIYLAYTTLGVILYLISGLDLFESVTTTFSSISTGGFTVRDNIFTNANDMMLATACILMILGSINFIIHDKLLRKRFREVAQNVELISMLAITIITTAVIYILTKDMRLSIFETVSSLTATGFTLKDITALPVPVTLIMVILMYIGSSSGSTAGGIKQLRFLISLKSISWTINKMIGPKNAIIPLKLDHTKVDDSTVNLTGTVIFTYTLVLILGTMALMTAGYPPVDSLFQTASAQGTVGLSIIDIPTATPFVKLTLIAVMLLGRLEIFPILILLNNMIKRR